MSSPRHAQPSQRRSARRGRATAVSSRPATGLVAGADAPAAAAALRPTPLPEHPGLRPSSAQQELICSAIGLTLKLGLSLVAVVSLVRLAGAYQERLDRHGEITAVLEIQKAKLLKARDRFDRLFTTGGEQRLIEEQDQWIAPNRLRVVWDQPQRQISATGSPAATPAASAFPTVEQPPGATGKPTAHP